MFQGTLAKSVVLVAVAGLWACGTEADLNLETVPVGPTASQSLKTFDQPQIMTPLNLDGLRAELDESVVGSIPVLDFEYARGELCTFSAEAYSDYGAQDGEAVFVRDMYFETVFPQGLEVGWSPRVLFTSAQRVGKALPGQQAPSGLAGNQTDPQLIELNRLAAQVAALHMNVTFGDYGLMGKGVFGDAQVVGGAFDGWTVREVADVGHGVLSRHMELLAPLGIDEVDLAEELARLNAGAENCQPATYLRRAH
jgi:hypothetical protein